jgi:lipid A 3-O-deacylase
VSLFTALTLLAVTSVRGEPLNLALGETQSRDPRSQNPRSQYADRGDVPKDMSASTPRDFFASALDSSWTFSVYFENDLFADTDQQYTNGVKLSWVSPEVSQYGSVDELPIWTRKFVEHMPFVHRTGPTQQRNVVLSVGQSIYTPQDISHGELIVNDRPYAGWLYVGAAFQNRNPRHMDDLELQIGVVGPLSLAEQAQTLVHEVRGLKRPRGWNNQLRTEPAFAVIYHRTRRFAPAPLWRHFGYDVIGYVGGALGTVYTYADVGMVLRVGWRLPGDFGSSVIRPGSDTSAPIEPGQPARNRRFGVQLFASAEGRMVGRNLFLDGNTFGPSHSVDKKTYVADFSAGVSFVLGRSKLSFTKVLRTREFVGQPRTHRFGSIGLSVSF